MMEAAAWAATRIADACANPWACASTLVKCATGSAGAWFLPPGHPTLAAATLRKTVEGTASATRSGVWGCLSPAHEHVRFVTLSPRRRSRERAGERGGPQKGTSSPRPSPPLRGREGGNSVRPFRDSKRDPLSGKSLTAAAARRSASRSAGSPGSLTRSGPDPGAAAPVWTTCANSCASNRRPSSVPVAYPPVPNTTLFPTVYASAFTACADSAA